MRPLEVKPPSLPPRMRLGRCSSLRIECAGASRKLKKKSKMGRYCLFVSLSLSFAFSFIRAGYIPQEPLSPCTKRRRRRRKSGPPLQSSSPLYPAPIGFPPSPLPERNQPVVFFSCKTAIFFFFRLSSFLDDDGPSHPSRVIKCRTAPTDGPSCCALESTAATIHTGRAKKHRRRHHQYHSRPRIV